MSQDQFEEQGRFIASVALEAAEESDAIARHPEVIDVLTELPERDGFRELFGANGHDPEAFVNALAEGLVPYREQPMEIDPELVSGLALIASALAHNRTA